MSQITTHILDTSKGKPAEGVRVTLEKPGDGREWISIANGVTDADGRITDLLRTDNMLDPGHYRLTFETASYFAAQKTGRFYPFVQIVFEITDAAHYHIPLLLNPFGYTTYRGS